MITILLKNKYKFHGVFITEKYIASGCQLLKHEQSQDLACYYPDDSLINEYKKVIKNLKKGKLDGLNVINLKKFKAEKGTYEYDNIQCLKVLEANKYTPRTYGNIDEYDKRSFVLSQVSNEFFEQYFNYEKSDSVKIENINRLSDKNLIKLINKCDVYEREEYIIEMFKRYPEKTINEYIISNIEWFTRLRDKISEMIDNYIWVNNCNDEIIKNAFKIIIEFSNQHLLSRYTKNKKYVELLSEIFKTYETIHISKEIIDIAKYFDNDSLLYIYKNGYGFVSELANKTAHRFSVNVIKDLIIYFDTKDNFQGYSIIKELLFELYKKEKITINE